MAEIITKCKLLLDAYKSGKLGDCKMPEDAHPKFASDEERLIYFTLPMALNYQRDSYKLWASALKTFEDPQTRFVFDISKLGVFDEVALKEALTKYKLALQPNKQTKTWKRIGITINNQFGSMSGLFEECDYDFLKLKKLIQERFKSYFPYLSGPKIFNYWSYIIQEYGGIKLNNSEYISIAPDTHVLQASVKLGVLKSEEAKTMTREQVSEKWRELLHDSGINPINMHSPLWFWSRSGFKYKI